ncbi:MAG: hypothetical protein ACOCU4_08300 [Alkalispirochaeta sp.]
MNEIQFVELARRCRTGDIVTAEDGAGKRTGRGVIVSFVDPAKPLLAFVVEGHVVAEFFQDVFYAASPWIAADYITVTRPASLPGTESAHTDAWAATMSAVFGMPFTTDSERFDAYAAGVFGVPRPVSSAVYRWIESRIVKPADVEELLADRVSIWEGYRNYAFS